MISSREFFLGNPAIIQCNNLKMLSGCCSRPTMSTILGSCLNHAVQVE
jgi:hypothetical protein